MARPPKGSKIEGGYFIVSAKRFLEDETLFNESLTESFLRCLAVMQLTNPFGGVYSHAGISLTSSQICKKGRIKLHAFYKLMKNGLIKQDANKAFFIPNWGEYQSQQTKNRCKERNFDKINESLNESLNETQSLPEALIKNQLKNFKPPSGSKNNAHEPTNGTSKTDTVFKNKVAIEKLQRRNDEIYSALPNSLSDEMEFQLRRELKENDQKIDNLNPNKDSDNLDW